MATDENAGPEGADPMPDPRWIDETQAALDRTVDALRVAWAASRDTRLAALNSAKRTVAELNEAVEEGIAAAGARWTATQPNAAAEAVPAPEPDEPET